MKDWRTVAPEWRAEIERFVDSGEASLRLLSAMIHDARVREAIDLAYEEELSKADDVIAMINQMEQERLN